MTTPFGVPEVTGGFPEGGERHSRFLRIKVLGDVTVDERPGHRGSRAPNQGTLETFDPPDGGRRPRTMRPSLAPNPKTLARLAPHARARSQGGANRERNGGGVHTVAVSHVLRRVTENLSRGDRPM
jgi:hypothetical protein